MKTSSRTANRQHRRRGFTMVEILAVVAIIGILAAILTPTIGGVMEKVAQGNASTNLRQIAQAYITYDRIITNDSSGGDSSPKNGVATDVPTYAQVLAENNVLESGTVWYVKNDPKCPNDIPKQVMSEGTNQLKSKKNVAWAVVVNAKRAYYKKDTYPLLWTRGLLVSGEWDKEQGVWGDIGGHIAFGDGHTVWVKNTTDRENKFVKADRTNSTTASYQEAIAGSGSSGDQNQPTVYEDK